MAVPPTRVALGAPCESHEQDAVSNRATDTTRSALSNMTRARALTRVALTRSCELALCSCASRPIAAPAVSRSAWLRIDAGQRLPAPSTSATTSSRRTAARRGLLLLPDPARVLTASCASGAAGERAAATTAARRCACSRPTRAAVRRTARSSPGARRLRGNLDAVRFSVQSNPLNSPLYLRPLGPRLASAHDLRRDDGCGADRRLDRRRRTMNRARSPA